MAEPGTKPLVFTLRRQAETPLSTIGLLDPGGWNGGPIWVLEPGRNAAQHPRIPAGDYPLELRPVGGKWEKFRDVPALHDLIAPGLPHLRMFPERYVLIHPGNTYHDTEACQLPGLTRWTPEMTESGQWEVGDSRAAFVKLYPVLQAAIQGPGAIWRVLEAVAVPQEREGSSND